MTVIFRVFSFSWFLFILGFSKSDKSIGVAEKPSAINVSANFEAISDGEKVIVNWMSFADKSYDYFTIEKSKDGVNFYSALMIKSFGKLTNSHEYIDIDYSPFSGVSYYRLRQNDYYGEFSYSPIITVNCQVLSDGSVLPITENAQLTKDLNYLEGKPILVVLRDAKGLEYVSKIVISTKAGTIYAKDTNHELSSGNYVVVASSCNPLYHQKVTLR